MARMKRMFLVAASTVLSTGLFLGCVEGPEPATDSPPVPSPTKMHDLPLCVAALEAPPSGGSSTTPQSTPVTICPPGTSVGVCYHCGGSGGVRACCGAAYDCHCMNIPPECPNAGSQTPTTMPLLATATKTGTFRVNKYNNCTTCSDANSAITVSGVGSSVYFVGDDGNIYGPNHGAPLVQAPGGKVRLSSLYSTDKWGTNEPIQFPLNGKTATMYKNWQLDEYIYVDSHTNTCVIRGGDC